VVAELTHVPGSSGPGVTTWADVCAHRIAAHSLHEPAGPQRLVDVVRALCGVHAQVASAAEVSIGIRVAGITRDDVRAALWEHRTLVRTYGPRGTVHVFPADELDLWLAALAAAPTRVTRPDPERGLTDEQEAEVLAAIAGALADGRAPTWRELGDEVVSSTGAWAAEEVYPAFGEYWPRWRPAIGTAARRGILVFGPNRGNQVTYLGTRHWLPTTATAPADGAGALAAVALRWLATYGPATPAQFAQWLGMLPAAATALFATLDLDGVDVDGRAAWLPAGTALRTCDPPVRLLPHFDAYLVGCHPRPAVFPGRASEQALSGGAAGPVPALLVDGVVAGIWQHRRSGRRTAVTVEPFVALTDAQLATVHAEADRIGHITATTATVAIGTVTTRPHL
jgi:hypothetical protein